MKRNAVVAVIIDSQRRVLIGKRSLNRQSAPGYWVPISGNIEPGETEQQALYREAFEEAGIKIKPIIKLGVINSHDEEFQLHWWKAEILEGSPSLNNDEFTEMKWVGANELKRLSPSFPEDIKILEAALKKADAKHFNI